MKASELFDKLKKSYLSSNPTSESLKKFGEIKSEFLETEISKQNYFYQVRKSEYYEGDLTFELMFFNSEFVHDIGIANHRINIITVPTQKIVRVGFSYIGTNRLRLTINAYGYDGGTPDLYYETGIKRLQRLILVRNNLLGLIK